MYTLLDQHIYCGCLCARLMYKPSHIEVLRLNVHA